MARNKKRDSAAMPGRKTLFDNHLFAEEPTTALRSNVGITARLLGTCCMGGTSASTKSPVGSKPPVVGSWEDCPAFDLDPVTSRQASAAASVSAQGLSAAEACGDMGTRYRPQQSRQVPVGEAEQAQRDVDGRPGSAVRAVTVNALSSPQTQIADVSLVPASLLSPSVARTTPGAKADAHTIGGGGGSASSSSVSTPAAVPEPTPPPIIATQTQDSAADMYNSDNESLPAAESPLAQAQPRVRQHMQHRVALRLLERRGVLPDGRTSASDSAGGGSPGSTSGGGTPAYGGGSIVDGGGSPGSGGGDVSPGALAMSPNSVRGGSTAEYYSALSSPVVVTPDGDPVAAGVMPVESAIEVDERLCLQAGEEDDPLELRGAGYRVSAPGAGLRAAVPGRPGWGYAGAGGRYAAPAARGGGAAGAPDGSDGDIPLRMRGSDFGGVMGGALPEGVFVRARARAADGGGGGGTPRSAVVPLSPGDNDVSGVAVGVGGGAQRLRAPQLAWSAAGGRVELSLEEKEWLFGQPGGIGGLSPVMALGEGGEGVVDLVRLDLPCRTLHLARKATRTCLPAFALTASGAGPAAAAAAVLGVRSQKVSYRFPFEFFDREVKAMKAVKESGFVVRFQAAAYDHEAGQGFILMEAAPYGTLEDLHAALSRSQLQPIQRQRPALLQRAFAKFNFKSSAPPSLVGGGADAAASSAVSTPRAGGNLPPHSPASNGGDRPSLPRPPAGGGIGSCGGAALDGQDRERFSCCSGAAAAVGGGGGIGGFGGPEPAEAAAAAGPSCGSGGSTHIAALGSSLMSTRALRYYGACMLQALVSLHEAGYVYRDLKLSNVLVCDGGRVRLTDFGAATPSLPDQPGRFGGAAGTRAYLAPEVLPWLEAGAGGGRAKRNSTSGGGGSGAGGGPEPYTTTVDSWTWGLVMVELATGWSLKELTQRIIRRVCAPRGPELPDLPPDCGLPPALRQLLLDHVLVRDPWERWPAARIRGHRFFEGIDWGALHEVEGPHSHLFARGRLANVPPAAVSDGPDAVVAAMLEGEMKAAGRLRERGSRPSPLAVGGGGRFGWELQGDGEACGGGNAVVPLGPRPSGLSTGRPSSAGAAAPLSPMTPGLLSPSGVLVSPVVVGSGGGGRASGTGYANTALSPSGAGGRSGSVSPVLGTAGGTGTGSVSPVLGASHVRQSSPGNAGLGVGPVVVGPPSPLMTSA